MGATWPRGSVPPSGSFGPFADPGESSTYVSPSTDFWRRIARVSAGRGAYWLSISIVAFSSPVCLSSPTETTLPTLTPEIRTSDSAASCTACSNSTSNRYPLAASGIEPPNDVHRNTSSPTQLSTNSTIARILDAPGACSCITDLPRRDRTGS